MSFARGGDLNRKPLVESFQCQICEQELGKLSEQLRQAHYDQHFLEESQQPQPSTTVPSTSTSSKNIFWYPSANIARPDNFTPDLIPLLKKSLSTSHQRGHTRKAVLCHPQAVHVGIETWDRGWGCGYRNFLMACASLIEQKAQPSYVRLLRDPTPPGVQNLQLWIEDAWASGYDAEGAEQLHHNVVDTRKWIGTAELYVAFTSRGIPCQLIDFYLNSKGAENKLIDWVVTYFTPPTQPQRTVNDALRGAQPITVTELMPIVLQHQGHSRTIIGYEVTGTGCINLLLFDPSKTPKPFVKKAVLAKASSPHSPKGLSSRIKHSMLSLHGIKSKKRKASDSASELATAKRVRGDESVIVIDDDESHNLPAHTSEESNTDMNDACKSVLSFARVRSDALGKKDKYQILYFPLSAPLTKAEKQGRRTVTSQKI